ncbi:uncharacterized protein LOC144667497 [Oculina patagonica]
MAEKPVGDKCLIAKSQKRHKRADPFQRTFQIVEGGTERGKRKLIDSFGYTYNVKRHQGNTTTWQCTIRTRDHRCRAAVSQRADGSFAVGSRTHSHLPAFGAEIEARIKSRIKNEAAADLFKPASQIVREVLQEEFRGAPCPSLLRPEYLARMANRFREKLRPADYD